MLAFPVALPTKHLQRSYISLLPAADRARLLIMADNVRANGDENNLQHFLAFAESMVFVSRRTTYSVFFAFKITTAQTFSLPFKSISLCVGLKTGRSKSLWQGLLQWKELLAPTCTPMKRKAVKNTRARSVMFCVCHKNVYPIPYAIALVVKQSLNCSLAKFPPPAL